MWWPLSGLRGQLLLGHLVVIVVGLGTLLLTFGVAVPTVFERHVAQMRGRGMGVEPGLSEMMGGRPGVMLVELERQVTEAYRRSLMESLALGGLAALGTAVLLSLFVSRQVAGQISRLAFASGRIADGRYAERVPVSGPEELRRLADSFNVMAAALEDTEQRRLELIGDVAHELRTPIATLQGHLEGLLDGIVDPSPETWALLHGETSRLRRLVDDLQELSRAESGRLVVAARPFDPLPLIRSTAERLAGDFSAKGLSLELELPSSLPEIRADPDRVVQVLTNLLVNALRYTPAGGRVRVTASAPGSNTSGSVVIAVADTGIGIGPDDLPHVFERFYRADKSRSRALGGSGIGLTIARALTEAMGGEIQAVSAGLGQGAIFSFTLPRASANATLIDSVSGHRLLPPSTQPEELAEPHGRPE